MQFEMNHKVGTDYSTVRFYPHSVRDMALFNIVDTFQRLGGVAGKTISEWKFPSFITSQVIEQVIHNTCFVCGGLMKDSTAMVDQEFKFEHDVYGTVTQQIPGYAKQIKVRKCSSCGHSHT